MDGTLLMRVRLLPGGKVALVPDEASDAHHGVRVAVRPYAPSSLRKRPDFSVPLTNVHHCVLVHLPVPPAPIDRTA